MPATPCSTRVQALPAVQLIIISVCLLRVCLLLIVLQVAVEAAAAVQPTAELAMQYAPDLVDGPVTDLEVEMAESHTGGNLLRNGLEWMVEEGLEVTNFTESNFAAVG